jgi:hypothetical protein
MTKRQFAIGPNRTNWTVIRVTGYFKGRSIFIFWPNPFISSKQEENNILLLPFHSYFYPSLRDCTIQRGSRRAEEQISAPKRIGSFTLSHRLIISPPPTHHASPSPSPPPIIPIPQPPVDFRRLHSLLSQFQFLPFP